MEATTNLKEESADKLDVLGAGNEDQPASL